MMGDHPRKREVCSLGNLSTSSRDQAEGLGSLTELQSLRKHRSKFQAKHQSPEYKAGNQNRDRDNGVSETQTHSLTLGYGRGLAPHFRWAQDQKKTHRALSEAGRHWPTASQLHPVSSHQKTKLWYQGPWQMADLQVRSKWLNPAVEVVNLQGLRAKKIIMSSNRAWQNSYSLEIMVCISTETKRIEN